MNAPSKLNDATLNVAFSTGPASNTSLVAHRLTFDAFAERLAHPSIGPKDGSYYVRGGDLVEPRRGNDNLRTADLLILDGDSRIDPETGEVLSGAPPMESVTAVLDAASLNHVAHTSHSHVTGELEKWRIIIPCRMANSLQLDQAYSYVLHLLHSSGVLLAPNKESRTWCQAWYEPRVRDQAALSGFKYKRRVDGVALDMADVERWYDAHEKAEAAIARAVAVTADDGDVGPGGAMEVASPIKQFNSAHGLDWVRLELERNGYTFRYRKGDTYRYVAPSSESGSSGVVVFKGKYGDWCTYSHHGAHDSLSGRVTDPFGLYATFRHGGDRSQALKDVLDNASGFSLYGTDAASAYGPSMPSVLWDPWAEPFVPAFPLDTLPDPVARYVESRGIETGACRSAIATACLAAASGALTHAARLYLKPGNNFGVSPRLWVVLVGNPSAKKSPVIDGAVKPLLKHQKTVQSSEMGVWELTKEENKKKDSVPHLTQFVLSDLTPEVLADVLSHQDRGILISADELAGWLGGHDRYGTGKGAASARATWLSAYNGGYYNLKRIGRQTVPVENLSASIIGGVQPERLRELGNLTSDGLLQRFLPVWMAKPVLDSNQFPPDTVRGWEEQVGALLAFEAFSIELSPEAQAERERVSEILFELGQVESESTAWQGFVGKLPGIWGSLALILHAMWGYGADDAVSLATARRASRIIEEFILPHGLAFYRYLIGAEQSDNRSIAGFLASWEGDHITVRDFTRGPRCCRAVAPEDINKRLQPFETGGWLEPVKPGPWNRAWRVTPGLAERFSRQVSRHKAAVAAIQEKIQRGGGDDE